MFAFSSEKSIFLPKRISVRQQNSGWVGGATQSSHQHTGSGSVCVAKGVQSMRQAAKPLAELAWL